MKNFVLFRLTTIYTVIVISRNKKHTTVEIERICINVCGLKIYENLMAPG